MRHGCSGIIRKSVSHVRFMYLPSLTISWLSPLDLSRLHYLLFFTSATYNTAESTVTLKETWPSWTLAEVEPDVKSLPQKITEEVMFKKTARANALRYRAHDPWAFSWTSFRRFIFPSWSTWIYTSAKILKRETETPAWCSDGNVLGLLETSNATPNRLGTIVTWSRPAESNQDF